MKGKALLKTNLYFCCNNCKAKIKERGSTCWPEHTVNVNYNDTPFTLSQGLEIPIFKQHTTALSREYDITFMTIFNWSLYKKKPQEMIQDECAMTQINHNFSKLPFPFWWCWNLELTSVLRLQQADRLPPIASEPLWSAQFVKAWKGASVHSLSWILSTISTGSSSVSRSWSTETQEQTSQILQGGGSDRGWFWLYECVCVCVCVCMCVCEGLIE